MKKMSSMFVLLLLTACDKVMDSRFEAANSISGPQGDPGQNGNTGPEGPQGPPGLPGTSTSVSSSPANSSQCASGGIVLNIGNTFTVLCNGTNGADGSNGSSPVISTTSASSSQCTAGGTILNINGNSTVICNGVSGSAGTNGASPIIFTTNATASQCANGGTVLSINGQSTVICNGTNGSQGVAGKNGTNGTNGQNGNGFNSGVECEVYSIPTSTYENSSGYITVNWAAMFAAGTQKFSVVLPNFNTPNETNTVLFQGFTSADSALVGNTNFALDCEGYINVPETGSYILQLGSDDGSQLIIDDTVVINMPQAQAFATANTTPLTLFSGNHKINVLYFQGPATNQGLQLSWQGPSNVGLGTMSLIPSSAFLH